jgi:acyl transferase domain-containing protein/acyl carrier protein
MNPSQSENSARDLDIAVIGMAGRFPGAVSIEEFWQNLRKGTESISFLSEDELRAMGVPLATIRHPHFVNAAPVLSGIDRFDANFFGYAPREAEIMDPQHRLFLECAWEALESAGLQTDQYDGLISVYAGTSLSSYLLYNLFPGLADIHSGESLEMMIGNDKDFLSTRVAYKLNLKGPAITVQTGCSTSLVAVHLACQALLNYQCDVALAGGVSVHVPQRSGYYYQENGVTSPDGHCRAFDARAQGTLFGSGAGIVVLKRLEEALQDGDPIHAVVKGSAINNDGLQKVGYTAPSVEGQASVILAAQNIAQVDPESITYVECHGTATALGDPVEFQALARAFTARTDRRQFCALGSVKSNIGHLDAAAGIAGFIKTVLALENRALPPSLHFETANPKINLENSPFYVNRTLQEWRNGAAPLRAAVSSFGIGGTNAHVILEESPAISPSGSSRDFQLLLWSAKTLPALDTATLQLADYFRRHPETNIADAAYTLAIGRKNFPFRRAVVCNGAADALSVLEKHDPARVLTLQHDPGTSTIAFMFPGGGAQYPNMGLDLYRSEPVFREEVDRCCEILRGLLGFDIREYLFPTQENWKRASSQMKVPLIALPALFTIEYALARLWMHWGVVPQALLGHSLGEYTAACLASVFSLEDALALVVTRGRLFEMLPPGSMAVVPLSEKELLPALTPHLSLAAINGETQCVVSGVKDEVESLIATLSEQEIECRRVQVFGAGHSHMVDAVLAPFRQFVLTLQFYPPQIPFLSNVTGTWITASEAADPEYWVQHLRRPVLFGPGTKELLRNPRQILLEVGPGHSLSSLAKLQIEPGSAQLCVSSMRHLYDQQSDVKFLLTAMGKLWLAGASIDWKRFYQDERRLRLALPSYPFQRQRYWIQAPAPDALQCAGLDKIWNVDEWFYTPVWRSSILPLCSSSTIATGECWVVFAGRDELAETVVQALAGKGASVVTVKAGDEFRKLDRLEYLINPYRGDEYLHLLEDLRKQGMEPKNVLHLWGLPSLGGETSPSETSPQARKDGLSVLLPMVQALAHRERRQPVGIWMISSNLYQIESTDEAIPEKAMCLAACMVIPQEYDNIFCKCIEMKPGATAAEASSQILRELECPAPECVAYRGRQRWVRNFERIRLEDAKEPAWDFNDKTYLITGGLGNVALQLVGRLAESKNARIALISRSRLPANEEWTLWLAKNGEDAPVSRKIRALQSAMQKGAEIMVLSADVADAAQVESAIDQVRGKWGEIDCVFHLAGITGETAMNLLSDLTPEECERHARAKREGVRNLEAALASTPPRVCALFSSTASVLGGIGSLAYSAANLFMDAFALSRNRSSHTRWISINWDAWLLEGEETPYSSLQTSMDRYAMTPAESWQALSRILALAPAGQIVVSTGNLRERMRLWLSSQTQVNEEAKVASTEERQGHARPALGTTYVPPSNGLEETVRAIWQQMLRIEQVGIYDNFFELGGNSLIGIKMISAIKKTLKVEIPVIALFQGPTVAALCEVIQKKQDNASLFEESRLRGQLRREGNMAVRLASASLPS